MTASAGSKSDDFNILGVAPDAGVSKDPMYLMASPPAAAQSVDLAFVRDLRAADGSGFATNGCNVPSLLSESLSAVTRLRDSLTARLDHLGDFVYSLTEFPRNPNLGHDGATPSAAARNRFISFPFPIARLLHGTCPG